MIEKREKQKRDLTASREAVFRKALEIVDDTTGTMFAEDIRWARACCVKNFTACEESEALGVGCPARPKLYKKRGRKPKQMSRKFNSGVVKTGVCSHSYCMTSDRKNSNCADRNENSTLCYRGDFNDHVCNGENTSRLDSTSNYVSLTTVDIDEKTLTSRFNSSVDPGTSKTYADISSNSDFEDASVTNAKHVSSLSKSPNYEDAGMDVNTLCDNASSIATTSLINTRSVSPLQPKVVLNDLKRSSSSISRKINDSLLRNRHRRSPNFKQNRKRLFFELSVQQDEPPTERTLRPKGTIIKDQPKCDAVPEKRVCHTNGILVSKRSDKTLCDSNWGYNAATIKSTLEENKKLEVRSTRSRSRASASNSFSKLSEQNPTVHDVNKQYKNRQMSSKHNNTSKKVKTTSEKVQRITEKSGMMPEKHVIMLEKNGKVSKNNAEMSEKKQRKLEKSVNLSDHYPMSSKNGHLLWTSTSTFNGDLCSGLENVVKNAIEPVANAMLRHREASDISSRTRSRSNTLDSWSQSVQKDVHDLSHVFLTVQNSETNRKQQQDDSKSCRTIRVDSSKAPLYSPTKCSRFFGKLRQAATSTA